MGEEGEREREERYDVRHSRVGKAWTDEEEGGDREFTGKYEALRGEWAR